jgi:predicted nucleic acid-binding protein
VNLVFADTFYWVALIHRKDASNKAVLELSRTLASALVTTDAVLTECWPFALQTNACEEMPLKLSGAFYRRAMST